MAGKSLTIAETISEIQGALRDYIEATYHIGHPQLIAQRQSLLEEDGVIAQTPYIESTPRYQATRKFSELRIPDAAKSLFASMSQKFGSLPPLLYDPPYTHQAAALESAINDGLSLVVSTGTGSGKTESFFLPTLARLATEARQSPASFEQSAVRCLLLYPMNALVNDQLGRLRSILGDARVSNQFVAWSGRPARFARYTSRTLYPGVRTAKKDQARLRSIERFYISLLAEASDRESPMCEQANELIQNLKARGKWPAKSDMRAWYGEPGSRWQDRSGRFLRAVMQHEDPELLTRHEVLSNPPDLLITNYSMLEYMLMRPLERPIFDATKAWLDQNESHRFLLIVDEAHLYRGAAGAEVALLLRRLRARLGIGADRMQVICTSASFNDEDYAREFAAQLTGKGAEDFLTIRGDLALKAREATGSEADVATLSRVDLNRFNKAEDANTRASAVQPFLEYRAAKYSGDVGRSLFEALRDFPPMKLLINVTMKEATPLRELGAKVFPSVDAEQAERAVSALIMMGSAAAPTKDDASLLPCRVHAFFRGLPGLWACADPSCTIRASEHAGSPVGMLYSQPRMTCGCGARVFELFTCRNCGSAYLRAYTNSLEDPRFLWQESGNEFLSVTALVTELQPIDLLLEEPTETVEVAELDLVTGRLNPNVLGERSRRVFLPSVRSGAPSNGSEDSKATVPSGEFKPCGVCGTAGVYGRSSVQDHLTKGDQPFQALITRQLEVQSVGEQPYTDFAPLRGRKVLTFSDSRQTAARLAPNLQTYSMQDVLRPVILRGWRALSSVESIESILTLDHLYLAALVGAKQLSVRLRPELKGAESLQAMRDVSELLEGGSLEDPAIAMQLLSMQTETPKALLRGLVTALTHRYYGLQALGLASIREQPKITSRLLALPSIPGVAVTDSEKLALARYWLSLWATPNAGIWFQGMSDSWVDKPGGVRRHSGRFAVLTRWLPNPQKRKSFERLWIPALIANFCELKAPGKYQLRASKLALDMGLEWGYCQTCRVTLRPFPGIDKCLNCARSQVRIIDPAVDPVFLARKGYYRASTVRALNDPPDPPLAIIAAEHTAQLNAAQADEVFSTAEEHEMLFQDVDLNISVQDSRPRSAIDVLSCTTTMEVGIDIGKLSGVALRNMPPSRASYQQRAGRAGRRGNAVATVVAFGSADSHDEHYFSYPDAMIRGPVVDPRLTLDNSEIVRRHVIAFLLQRYHQARLPLIQPEDQPQLFEVLGKVDDFVGSMAVLNRSDFESWLRENESSLVSDVAGWLPSELSAQDREYLLERLIEFCLEAVDEAIEGTSIAQVENASDEDISSLARLETPAEEGEEDPAMRGSSDNLLDRLLYKGVLPRYAFPTDVVSFYVFDQDRSAQSRHAYRYAPSQGLPTALTQYAPGKAVWIGGRLWTSGALYSPIGDERFRAWEARQLYFECSLCRYASTMDLSKGERGQVVDCPACGSEGTFGAAKNWIRPPGFAHPAFLEEGTSVDDQPARSYATRAKLVAPGPADAASWKSVTPRVRHYFHRTHLLVTNSGPRREGYTYCTKCGRIEPTAIPTRTLYSAHAKPFPDSKDPNCPGSRTASGVVLGTDFVSDVLLISLRVDEPMTLQPGLLATEVALRTLCEAFAVTAARMLEIEDGELQAEYRPALSAGEHHGLEAEIYMYDTLAGGAGFARRVGDLGLDLYTKTIRRLEECPAECDQSCYRCLRSFKNRFEHGLLDRHLGASLLRFVVDGEVPMLDKRKAYHAAERLYEDLKRQGLAGVETRLQAEVDIVGVGIVEAPILVSSQKGHFIVDVHGPLTPNFSGLPNLQNARTRSGPISVIRVDELVITRNLPYASQEVIAMVTEPISS